VQQEEDSRRREAAKSKKRSAEDRQRDQLKGKAAKFRLHTIDTPTRIVKITPDPSLKLIAGPASRTIFLKSSPADAGES
jgi:hypothetical protein